MLSPQEALVYTMVATAEADHEIAEAEINLIGDLGNHLPVFRGMDRATLTALAVACSRALARPGGRERCSARSARRCRASCATPPMRSPAM